MITDQRDEIDQATGKKSGTRITVYPDNGPGTSVLVRNTYALGNTDYIIAQVTQMLQFVVSRDLVPPQDYPVAALDSFVAAIIGPPLTSTAAMLAASGSFTASQLPH
jgi:hypothetical protein